MAKYRKKSKRSGRSKPSIVSMVPIGFLAYRGIAGYADGGAKGSIRDIAASLSGVDVTTGQFNVNYAVPFYSTLIATYAAKKVIGITGVNRSMKSLPFRL